MPTAPSASRRSASVSGRVFVRTVSSCAVALRLLRRWHARYRQRRDLGDLDDRLLDDIGVTRADAEEEQRKPFWR